MTQRHLSKKENLKPALKDVISILENHPMPFGSKNDDSHIIVINAFKKYLSEDISLEKAFGLLEEGAPPTTEEYKQHVVGKVHEARNQSITWENMPEYLRKNYKIDLLSEKTLKDWYKEKDKTRVLIDSLSRKLSENERK